VDGGLSFDTLINFSPFEFDTAISGKDAASYRGYDIASVALSLELSGPNPWHASGKAKVSVLCWDVTARFNKIWGNDNKARLPAVRSIAALPRGTACRCELGIRTPCAIRQRVLPLQIQLEKFGNADATGHYLFDVNLTLAPNADPPLDYPVEVIRVDEHFARGQFKALTKAERLSLPGRHRLQPRHGMRRTGSFQSDKRRLHQPHPGEVRPNSMPGCVFSV
jgi:hypothetical protein